LSALLLELRHCRGHLVLLAAGAIRHVETTDAALFVNLFEALLQKVLDLEGNIFFEHAPHIILYELIDFCEYPERVFAAGLVGHVTCLHEELEVGLLDVAFNSLLTNEIGNDLQALGNSLLILILHTGIDDQSERFFLLVNFEA
jgi:hypothetical protein